MAILLKVCVVCSGLLVLSGGASAIATAESELFDPDNGYRIARYRAPTPDSVAGGTRIDIDEFDRLVREENAALVDVMVAEGGGPHPKTGVWRLSKPRRSIPGATWLADVGKGDLSGKLRSYFAQELTRLTAGNLNHPIIIFCQADCWMSWNAVKRAASFGYTRIFWYPEGTDGWRDWDREFHIAIPVPVNPVKVAEAKGGGGTSTATRLPSGNKTATLITASGERIDIANVTFTSGQSAAEAAFEIELIDAPFQEEFLSMRPFRCLPDTEEMWCHLAYPYENKQRISASDLQDLEYGLLFLFKPPQGYGIDAWNGLYFKLALQSDGSLSGQVHETDMNVLAVPPEDGELRPISHDALTPVDPDTHRFHKIEIR